MVTGRKQREVYVGNLTIGVVTDVMLKELFSGALAHLVPDPIGNPPVVNAQLDPSGATHPTEEPAVDLYSALLSPRLPSVYYACVRTTALGLRQN